MNPCGGWHYYKRVGRYGGARAAIDTTFTSSTIHSSTCNNFEDSIFLEGVQSKNLTASVNKKQNTSFVSHVIYILKLPW
jgi:hypothetical protein